MRLNLQSMERAARGGQRDARPVFADAVGVVAQIRRAVTDGQRVHPDEFGGVCVGVGVGKGERGEVGAGGGGEVGRRVRKPVFLSVTGLLLR